MMHGYLRERKARATKIAGRCSRSLLGFTLVELMVTIAMVAILLALAAPSFSDAALSSKLAANANRLAASATLARSEAIKRNVTVTLCTSVNGTSCATTGGWEQGWIVLNGTTVLLRELAAPSGYKINETSATTVRTLMFQATGVGSTQADFKVCRAMPKVGNQERVVSVSPTGRTSVTTTRTADCT